MLKRLHYRFYLFFRRTFPRLLQFLCRIRRIIHCQSQRPFHFCNISGMYLKSILLPHIFLYHLICDFRFWLIFLRSFCNRIQRYLIVAFSKFYLYVNNTVRGFVGQKYNRLDMSTKLKHVPTKLRKCRQYLYSTNTARASLFPQNISSTNFAPP